MSRAFRPDHVNVACPGNTIPHLRMGVIPRYRSDPRRGHSIWTSEGMIQALATDAGCENLARQLRDSIGNTAGNR